ncbi:DUF397 domain-containing protein [Streptomyces sp. NPDC056524]|uniref:DUF397 domain-containing protein n=1 Tax=Streptomyces sp. NPDC056524 TaxID=3345851 RepID=UPI0036A36DE6
MTNASPSPRLSNRQWFKSSYSNGSGGECVECARAGGGTLVRDSKRADGHVIAVGAAAWRAFVAAAAAGGLRRGHVTTTP